jgi:hypothetical protein
MLLEENLLENDEESSKIRAKAYEIVLKKEIGKIDGFFFSKFQRNYKTVFTKYFMNN